MLVTLGILPRRCACHVLRVIINQSQVMRLARLAAHVRQPIAQDQHRPLNVRVHGQDVAKIRTVLGPNPAGGIHQLVAEVADVSLAIRTIPEMESVNQENIPACILRKVFVVTVFTRLVRDSALLLKE